MARPVPHLFVVNPVSGSGRAGGLVPRIRDWLSAQAQDAKLVETRAPGDAERYAAAAAREGFGRVVAVGGDGTLQEVLNGVLSAGAEPDGVPEVGLVPSGRGNDVARSLGLPSSSTLPACLALATGAATVPFDVAQARNGEGRERFFGAAGGVGFDAQVAHTMQVRRRFWMRGEAGYILATLNELRRFDNHALHLALGEGVARTVSGRFLFVAFANSPYYGGGMQICPGASTNDGLLDACLVGDLSRFAALRELPGIYSARHVKHPKVEIVRTPKLRIEGGTQTRIHLDGEPFGSLPVDVLVRPAAVRFAAPAAG